MALLALVFLFIYFFKGNKILPVFNKCKLVIEKKCPIKMILRYSNKRETEMKLKGEKIPKKDEVKLTENNYIQDILLSLI